MGSVVQSGGFWDLHINSPSCVGNLFGRESSHHCSNFPMSETHRNATSRFNRVSKNQIFFWVMTFFLGDAWWQKKNEFCVSKHRCFMDLFAKIFANMVTNSANSADSATCLPISAPRTYRTCSNLLRTVVLFCTTQDARSLYPEWVSGCAQPSKIQVMYQSIAACFV